MEKSNKRLEEENDKLQNDIKPSQTHINLHSVSTKPDLSSFSSSPESSRFKSSLDVNLHDTKPGLPQVSSPSHSDSRKPFPPVSVSAPQDLPTFKSFNQIKKKAHGKLFPPLGIVHAGNPHTPFQDGNNNLPVSTKKSDSFNEAKFVNDQNAVRDTINKSLF